MKKNIYIVRTLSGSMNRDKYLMMKEIVDVAIKYEGDVFGGYVRDFVLHDFMACKFFEENPGASQADYSNESISPGTIDRLLVPKDIDIHFRAYKDFRKFKLDLKSKCIHSKTIKTANFYILDNDVRHITLEMFARAKSKDFKNISRVVASHINDVSLPFSVKVDVIISNELSHRLDFECNGLVMNSNGIELCKYIADKFNSEGK